MVDGWRDVKVGDELGNWTFGGRTMSGKIASTGM